MNEHEAHPAHQGDPQENPADHIGEPIQDPWEDLDQKDWQTGRIDGGR